MAISCSRCGRQYDVTLFQFGRTIDCACGERVGLEHKMNLPPAAAARQVKFFADVNVARVVRWLRAVGVDTVWEDAIADGQLVRRAIEEGRFVLTLDKRLIQQWRADNIFLLRSETPLEQFSEIVARFDIKKPRELFTRCLLCNTLLRAARPEEISANAVPAHLREKHLREKHLREKQEVFHYCPACHKIYWEGSHTRRMREAIEEVFSRRAAG